MARASSLESQATSVTPLAWALLRMASSSPICASLVATIILPHRMWGMPRSEQYW